MSHLGRVILYKFAYIHEKIILNFNYRTLISTSAHKRGILNVSVLRLLVPGKPIFPIQLNPELCVTVRWCHFQPRLKGPKPPLPFLVKKSFLEATLLTDGFFA